MLMLMLMPPLLLPLPTGQEPPRPPPRGDPLPQGAWGRRPTSAASFSTAAG